MPRKVQVKTRLTGDDKRVTDLIHRAGARLEVTEPSSVKLYDVAAAWNVARSEYLAAYAVQDSIRKLDEFHPKHCAWENRVHAAEKAMEKALDEFKNIAKQVNRCSSTNGKDRCELVKKHKGKHLVVDEVLCPGTWRVVSTSPRRTDG